MNEETFEALNDRVIALGIDLGNRLSGLDVLAVQEYARAYAEQAIARAAMEQYRQGRHSLATQILEGQR